MTDFAMPGQATARGGEFACKYGWINCHRPSRQKGSGSRRGEQQGGELEGSAVPAIEPGEALDDFGIGVVLLDISEDALKRGLGLLKGRQDLATK